MPYEPLNQESSAKVSTTAFYLTDGDNVSPNGTSSYEDLYDHSHLIAIQLIKEPEGETSDVTLNFISTTIISPPFNGTLFAEDATGNLQLK